MKHKTQKNDGNLKLYEQLITIVHMYQKQQF